MSKLAINLQLNGDFIDSFIYSGTLYLLDTDFNFKSYAWKEICKYILDRNGFNNVEDATSIFNFAEDNRNIYSGTKGIDTLLTEVELSKLEIDTYNINCWPSDINLFANKLYFSGDDGVYFVETDFKTSGFIEHNRGAKNKIFDVKSFSIAPNSHSRVALAAGTEGVHSYCGYHNKKIEKNISSENCIDIDWVSDKLFLNSKCLTLKKFENIAKQNEINNDKKYAELKINLKPYADEQISKDLDKNDYERYLINILDKMPEDIDSEGYIYGWSSGDCDFYIDNEKSINVHNKIKETIRIIDGANYLKNMFKVRTSGCGTVLETEDGSIYTIDKNGFENVGDNIVNWRVFPRATTHANHLHVVNDDNIIIKIYSKGDVDDDFTSYQSKK